MNNRLLVILWLFLKPLISTAKGLAATNEHAIQQGPMITEPIGLGNFLQMFLGLGVVIIIIFSMAWLIRRMGRFQATVDGSLKILGALCITQRERIVLVQIGETQLLLGVAPGQIRTLHVLDRPIFVSKDNTVNMSTSFAQRLYILLKGRWAT